MHIEALTDYERGQVHEYIRYRARWQDYNRAVLRSIQRTQAPETQTAIRESRDHYERVMLSLAGGMSNTAKRYMKERDDAETTAKVGG